MPITALEVDTPLSGFAASPRSRNAARCGQGDAPGAAGRPLRGGSGLGRATCKGGRLCERSVFCS